MIGGNKMTEIDQNLLSESKELLEACDADALHKFSDRILTVQPENWLGLYTHGCYCALDADYDGMMSDWKRFIESLDDDALIVDIQPALSKYYAQCLLHLVTNKKLDMSDFGDFLANVNDKMPECEGESFLNTAMDIAIESLKEGKCSIPPLTYYAFKASVVTGFKAYVELPIFIELFTKLSQMLDIVLQNSTPKGAKVMDKDREFLDTMLSSMNWVIENCTPEELESVEEYWVEHDRNAYLAHVMQTYQFSLASAVGGFFMSKISKGAMKTSARNFVVRYLAPVKKSNS